MFIDGHDSSYLLNRFPDLDGKKSSDAQIWHVMIVMSRYTILISSLRF